MKCYHRIENVEKKHREYFRQTISSNDVSSSEDATTELSFATTPQSTHVRIYIYKYVYYV